ncbi:hypothetical protein [uncultured Pontibacter sp.]|uniref:hypothetical protein n=1 Tax=uncultured Pontibacter sp. TaxID=453356 RepID=UPI00262D6960|nr:hypothetical protein [uncultured Pontibacter sp.]
METNASGNLITLRQNILERIEEIISKEITSDYKASLADTKETYQAKLKSALTRYKVMRPITIAMTVLFILICIAQIGEFNFFFEWQQAALFILMTFSLTLNTANLKQQIEKYKQLLHLLQMMESLDKTK